MTRPTFQLFLPLALGLTLGSLFVLAMHGCGGTTMNTGHDDAGTGDDDGGNDAAPMDLDAGRDASEQLDAAMPTPGTWAFAEEAFTLGMKARRASWPSGFLVRRLVDGTYRSSSNGGATFSTVWAPSASDVAATDWLVFQ